VQAPTPREGPVERLAERMPLRILVAEDNVVNQQLALLVLQKLGYQAEVTANGLEALQALEREPYDVVLMDVQMPTIDGLEATRRIHQRWPEGRRPHVIAATASAMEEEREACLAAGMDDYLSKPIRVDELAAALRRCRPHVAPQLPAPASGSGEGAQVPPEREPEGRPALAGVLHPPGLERLMETIGGDRSLLTALVDTFLSDAPRLVEAARRGLEHGQTDEIRRAAHTLKSAYAEVQWGHLRGNELLGAGSPTRGSGQVGNPGRGGRAHRTDRCGVRAGQDRSGNGAGARQE
jgi:CheY-like chemotaxis protein